MLFARGVGDAEITMYTIDEALQYENIFEGRGNSPIVGCNLEGGVSFVRENKQCVVNSYLKLIVRKKLPNNSPQKRNVGTVQQFGIRSSLAVERNWRPSQQSLTKIREFQYV